MTSSPAKNWPLWTKDLLSPAEARRLPASWLKNLGTSQEKLWQALNIYDDFFDGSGQIDKLARANDSYRSFLETYYRAGLPADFYRLFKRLFQELWLANHEENQKSLIKIRSGRIIIPKKLTPLPGPSQIVKKSLVLSLGSIAIFSYLGYPIKGAKTQTFLKFWRKALAARQLADDAADWLEDLKQGKITRASGLLLSAARRRRVNLDLKKHQEIAHVLFAEVAPIITKQILELCRQARLEFERLKTIAETKENKLIKNIIIPLEKAASKAAAFQKLLR